MTDSEKRVPTLEEIREQIGKRAERGWYTEHEQKRHREIALMGFDLALADRVAEVARAAAEKAWREGWDAGFRDYQGARQDDDGYLVITPRPNPHRLEQTDD